MGICLGMRLLDHMFMIISKDKSDGPGPKSKLQHVIFFKALLRSVLFTVHII